MAVDEQAWRRATQALARTIGEAEADALIARFLDEPARRENLVGLETQLRTDIAQAAQRLDAKVNQVELRLDAKIDRVDAKLDFTREFVETRISEGNAEVIGAMRAEITSTVRTMFFGFAGLQLSIGAFVIGLLRFGA